MGVVYGPKGESERDRKATEEAWLEKDGTDVPSDQGPTDEDYSAEVEVPGRTARVNEVEGRTTRGTQRTPNVVATLRAAHHKVAQLIAGGMKYTEVAKAMGYTPARVQQLLADPTFQFLISEYRDLDMAETGDQLSTLQSLLMTNALNAELQIKQKLETALDEGETLPTRDLISISRDGADRLGLGKVSAKVNANLDFATMLDRAVKASRSVMGTVSVEAPSLVTHTQRMLAPPVSSVEASLPSSSDRGREVETVTSPPPHRRRV